MWSNTFCSSTSPRTPSANSPWACSPLFPTSYASTIADRRIVTSRISPKCGVKFTFVMYRATFTSSISRSDPPDSTLIPYDSARRLYPGVLGSRPSAQKWTPTIARWLIVLAELAPMFIPLRVPLMISGRLPVPYALTRIGCCSLRPDFFQSPNDSRQLSPRLSSSWSAELFRTSDTPLASDLTGDCGLSPELASDPPVLET